MLVRKFIHPALSAAKKKKEVNDDFVVDFYNTIFPQTVNRL